MNINKKLAVSAFVLILFTLSIFTFTGRSDEVDDSFRRGIKYTNKGDYDRAIREFTRVITEDREYADAYFSLAIAYINKKMEFEAVSLLQKAIELDPDNSRPYFVLAMLYERLEDNQKAIQTLEKFISMNPGERQLERAQKRLKRLQRQKLK